MKIGMEFSGGQELERALMQLPPNVGKSTMRAALREGGALIQHYAKSIAPRAPGAPDIAENIGISNAKTKGDEVAAIKIGPTKPGFAYGIPLELGSSKAPAQPFMRPAFDTQGRNALGAIGRALWAALAKKGIGTAPTSSRTQGGGGDLL